MAYVNPGFINESEPALDADNMNNLANAVELLSVENGGTGKNSITSGALLEGNGTDTIFELSGTGAVYAQTLNAPTFGTLPINCGGTGATTVDGIKAALGLTKSGFTVSDNAPANLNTLWIDTGNGGVLKYHDGTNWKAVASVYSE